MLATRFAPEPPSGARTGVVWATAAALGSAHRSNQNAAILGIPWPFSSSLRRRIPSNPSTALVNSRGQLLQKRTARPRNSCRPPASITGVDSARVDPTERFSDRADDYERY